jgi:GDP-L-fucose synthase
VSVPPGLHRERRGSALPLPTQRAGTLSEPRAARAAAQVPRRQGDGDATVEVWGSGSPRREFLHVDDLADACVFLMRHYNEPGPINVGTGEDLSIRELAVMIDEVVYPEADLVFDPTKPDGAPRKVLDVRRLRELDWSRTIDLRDGIVSTYEWFLANQDQDLRGMQTSTVG